MEEEHLDLPPAAAVTDDDEDEASVALSVSDYYSDTPLRPEPSYPPLPESFDSTILVMNLPAVDAGKFDKLKRVVHRIFSKVGTIPEGENGIRMPTGPEGRSLGFAFCEYAAPGDASNAVQAVDDYPMDKNHRLRVMPYADARRLRDVDVSAYRPPPPEAAPTPVDTTAWLRDSCQRDMFVIREGKNTVIHWNDPVKAGSGQGACSEVDYDGSREKAQGVNWCDYYVAWSPKGSYLATMHAKGVRLWGGAEYESIGRFLAEGVEDVTFSPCERYIMTNNFRPDDPAAVKIFDVASRKLLKSFGLYPPNFTTEEAPMEEGDEPVKRPPPKFAFSHDDKYVARMGQDLISIYEMPSLKLLDKRSVSAEGVAEFQWSPGANVIAYWAPEVRNSPAHVDLIEVPSRKFLRQKNLFHVSKCSMAWQSRGEYLGVKVLRHTKSKKTLFNNFELFRLNDPGIPVEMLEVKDAVMCFSWEPAGHRFAMIHAENPSSTKVNVSFYDMVKNVDKKSKKGKVIGTTVKRELTHTETLEGKQVTQLFWSPAGRHIIMAGLGDNASGTLEFYDVVEKTLAVKEHYRATEVLWDPSGRCAVTTVAQPIGGSYYKFQMDNGYMLWSFQGRQLHQQSYEDFYQFQWRPRESLLSKEEETNVITHLKKYEKRFDAEDKKRAKSKYIEETRGKRNQRQQFRDRVAQLNDFRARQKENRLELLGGYDSEDENNYEVSTVTNETVLNVKEEVM